MNLTFNPHAIPYFICSSIVLSLCMILFIKKREYILYLSYLSISLWFLGTGFAISASSANIWKIFYTISYSGVIFITPTLFHFVTQYTNKVHTSEYRYFIYLYYIIAIVFLYLNIFQSSLFKMQRLQWFNFGEATQIHHIFLVWFATSYLHMLSLLYKHLKSKQITNYDRNQTKYLLTTYLIASLGSLDFISKYNPKWYPFGYIISTIGFLVTAYAILRHQLLDFRIVIKRGLIYTILVAFISIFYLLFILSFEKYLQLLYGYNSFALSMLIALFLGLIFVPLKNKVQFYVEKVLFKNSTQEASEKIELLEREVADKEKFKTISTLASGMAHEIKNPLTAINTFTEYLPLKKDDPKFLDDFSKIVGKETQRINDIVNQLLTFSKPAPLEKKETHLHKLIDETLDFLNSQLIDKHITVKRDYDKSLTTLYIDANKIRQVLLNLFLNAIDAIPKGGTITVTTKLSNDTTTIEIKDTGIGIPKDKLKNVFDPFFTQKDHGTGLGLSISKSIIEDHQGKIKVESNSTKGTTFIINLQKGKNTSKI